jgi:integrase
MSDANASNSASHPASGPDSTESHEGNVVPLKVASKRHGGVQASTSKPKRLHQFAFTESRLARLQRVPGKTIIYYDANSPLAVRVTPAGVKTYLLYKWAVDRPLKLTQGRVGDVRLEDAKREAQRAVAAIAGGRDPVAERKAARVQGMTIGELWDRWRERKWHALRPKSQESFDSLWSNHLHKLGAKAVRALTRADLQTMVDRLVRSGRASTARHVQGLMHLLLGEAIRLDAVATNVAKGIEMPAYVPRSRIVLGHEREPLLAAIDAAPEPWSEFFRLLLMSGCRVSNLYAMRWEDVDLDAAIWRIPAGRSKSKRTTALPLVPDAVAILRHRLTKRAGEPWVFPSQHSRTGHVGSCRKAWAGVLERAGIEGLTRHDLRRSLGTTMAAMGAGDRIIAAALGHVSLSAVRVYTHLAGELARDAVTEAAAALTARKP